MFQEKNICDGIIIWKNDFIFFYLDFIETTPMVVVEKWT